ncbi:MAG: methylenetetrahydrofolate--tRNA-(uracil(54)-C(5))-methyltransferase (FADH(2)-oxidizing) TrmFO [Desulfobulbaceae bacterium A2]|nr:MAG: methylenetetrahydrofolate--tRNA-(uracil(54)-C(5))-methyltransferase (FADH(2)-oxidizing) TrmFO [Desulfobulbaceae bacterium A2]
MSDACITIIGGGLAGCEAAWQAARRGVSVRLYEMKPQRFSPAHALPGLAELVCSNSLRSNEVGSAVGLLKEEMRRLGSLLLAAAQATSVPAGRALAVDRERFAAWVTEKIEQHPAITVLRQEMTELPSHLEQPLVLATGPLTSAALTASLQRLTGADNLAFYDAIAPIVTSESIDRTIVYRRSRWEEGPGDYLNCPMDEEQYHRFIELLRGAATVPLKSFEEPRYFEGCLPIEVMLARGDETLRFGPMKPVGLPDPRSGREPHAVVQLRAENREETHYNMVGFQTKLTYPEQLRVFRAIPGLAQAEFARLGSIHRNTFVCAPRILLPTLQMKKEPLLLLAGQLSGVEGYVESGAMGLLAGINAARLATGRPPLVPPPQLALGALVGHLSESDPERFQPANVHFGLFPPLGKRLRKRDRGPERARLALEKLENWRRLAENDLENVSQEA